MLAPWTYNLRIPGGDCTLFRVSGLKAKCFRAKIRPKMRLGCLALELVHYSGSNHFQFQKTNIPSMLKAGRIILDWEKTQLSLTGTATSQGDLHGASKSSERVDGQGT